METVIGYHSKSNHKWSGRIVVRHSRLPNHAISRAESAMETLPTLGGRGAANEMRDTDRAREFYFKIEHPAFGFELRTIPRQNELRICRFPVGVVSRTEKEAETQVGALVDANHGLFGLRPSTFRKL